MPSGKVHACATTVTAIFAGPALAAVASASVSQAAAFTLGCLAGLVLTPDLDVNRGSRSHAVVRRSTNPLVGWLWNWFWLPYAWLVPHRSILSHFPVVGTLLRLAYLVAPGAILWWLMFNAGLPWVPALPASNPLWWWLFGGLAAVDALHALMDALV